MRITIDFKDSRPLWLQIEASVRRLVAAGVLAPGTLVTSVRELAQELGINPAVVAKAYHRLTEAGIFAQSWGATVIAFTDRELEQQERKRLLQEEAQQYASLACHLGISAEVATSEVTNALRNLQLRQGGLHIATKITSLGRRKVG